VSLTHWAERTLQRSLLATAEHTGRRIQAYTDDPATTSFQLVTGARRSLADLGAVRTRWQHATTPARPQRPRPRPATRAGPPTTTAARAARTSR
ncbi:replicative DNA helicase, partial [Streptomyces sp. STCH 565 A]|nr:replicative DNA helicase [Streptomyces sp. STCH 565 A]